MTTGADVVAAARAYLGMPYEYGGTLARGSLDCSELVLVAMRDLGLSVPDGSAAQIEACAPIPLDVAQRTPGALLYRPGHDGLSTGAPGVIEARAPVVVEGAWTETYDGGKARWTRAGLLPGLTYPEEAEMAALTITSPYGTRTITLKGKTSTSFHKGLDMRSPKGSAVVALFSGVVVKVTSGRLPDDPVGRIGAAGVPAHAPTLSGNAVSVLLADGSVYTEAHCDPRIAVGARVVAGRTILGETDASGTITAPHRHIERWRSLRYTTYYDPTDEVLEAVAQTRTPTTSTPSTSTTTTKPAAEAAPVSEEDDYMRLNLIRRTSDGALALTGPGVFINLSADANGYATAKRLWSYAIGNAKDAKGEYIPDNVLPVEWDRAGALSRRNEG